MLESEWSLDAVGAFSKDKTMSFNGDSAALSDDLWISSLLPASPTPKSNRRKNRIKKDISLSTGDQYKQVYQSISILSTEPLTNEEWTARRLDRERMTRAMRQVSNERNRRDLHEGQQYFRSDQGDIDTQDHEMLMPQDIPDDTVQNRDGRRPRHYHRGIIHRESVINRSRMAVSSAFRFIGSLSRLAEASSTSEAVLSPAFVGRGDISGTNGVDRGVDSFAGIRSRRRDRPAIQALDGDDESDDGTAFWSTGTAMETVVESVSSCGTSDEVEGVPSNEENQIIENMVFTEDEFVDWNHYTEAQKDGETPAFPHDPFVQFNCSGL